MRNRTARTWSARARRWSLTATRNSRGSSGLPAGGREKRGRFTQDVEKSKDDIKEKLKGHPTPPHYLKTRGKTNKIVSALHRTILLLNQDATDIALQQKYRGV